MWCAIVIGLFAGSEEVKPLHGESLQPWAVESLAPALGMDDAAVFDADFESDETVWLATSRGLARYDGFDVSWWTQRDGLPSDYVRCVEVLRDGHVLIGTQRGVIEWRDGRVGELPESSWLASRSVRRIVIDHDGTRWYCCDRWPCPGLQAGLLCWRGRSGRWFGTDDGLPSAYCSDLCLDPDGAHLLLTNRGAARYVGDRFERVAPDCLEARSYAWDAVRTDDGAWSVLQAGGVLIASDRGTQWLPLEGLGAKGCLARVDDRLMAACPSGTWSIDLGDGTSSATAHRVPYPGQLCGVERLLVGPTGALWVVGDRRLDRWARGRETWWEHEGVPSWIASFRNPSEHWFSDGAQLVQERGSHRCTWPVAGPTVFHAAELGWCEADLGLRQWDGFEWTLCGWPTDLEAPDEWAVDGNGTPWVTGRDVDGLLRVAYWDGSRWCVVDGWAQDGTVRALAGALGDGAWLLRAPGPARPADSIVRFRRGDSVPVFGAELPRRMGHAGDDALDVTGPNEAWVRGVYGAVRVDLVGDDVRWSPPPELPGRSVNGVLCRGQETWWSCASVTGGTGGLLRRHGTDLEHMQIASPRIVGRDRDDTFYVAGRGRLWSVPTSGVPRPIELPVEGDVSSVGDGLDGSLWVTIGSRVFRHRPVREAVRLAVAPQGGPHPSPWTVDLIAHARFRSEPQSYQPIAWRVAGAEWTVDEAWSGDTLALGVLEPGTHLFEVRSAESRGMGAARLLSVSARPLQQRAWFGPVVWGCVALLGGLGVTGWVLYRMVCRQRRALARVAASRSAAHREEARRYRRLFDESRDPLLLVQNDGSLRAVNGALVDLLGFPVDELMGMNAEGLFVGQDVHDLIHGECGSWTGSVRTRDGEAIEVTVTAQRFGSKGDALAGAQLMLRTAGRLHEQEETLRRTQKLDAVGRLAGGIAHDFNNLLMVILGNVEVLEASALVRSRSFGELEAIRSAAERAQQLSSRLRTFSRGQPMPTRPIDLAALVRRRVPLFDELLGSNVELSIQGVESACVRGDESQLEQVLMNLMVNARDASPEGGRVTVEVTVGSIDHAGDFTVEPLGRSVRLVVSDQGKGIDPAILPRIFDPFFTTKRSSEGSGLGLATVYGVVRQLGGTLEARNRRRRGASFTITFPRDAERAADVVEPVRVESADPVFVGGRVVVVEDDERIRELLTSVLPRWGFTALPFPLGEPALAWLDDPENDVDLLVTDVSMPGLNGVDLVRAVRRQRPDLPVLYMSGFSDAHGLEGELERADTSFLAKPFRMRELLAALDTVLSVTPSA